VIYRLAIAAVGAGSLSLGHAAVEFVWVTIGGILTGTLVATLAMVLRRWIREPEVEVTLSLVMPFAAYFPAERLGVSGVLAAVTAGFLLGRHANDATAAARLRGHAFWDVLVFLLNSTLFLLVGLTFPSVLHQLHRTPASELVWYSVAIAATLVVVRTAWMFLLPKLLLLFAPRRGARPASEELVILGWSGMRGGVSLAAALAVPMLAAGRPFPGRDELIFLTYMAVLATLVVPGLTLGRLISRLGLGSDDAIRSDARVRAHLLRAALEHIDELARNNELEEEIVDLLRDLYIARLDDLRPPLPNTAGNDDGTDRSDAMLQAQRGAITAQREALADLQLTGRVSGEDARLIEEELDTEEASSRLRG
jgi:CPA1 family monovalent cation:H+ antiporter